MKTGLKGIRIYIEESVIIVIFVCLFSKVAREYLGNYSICFLFIIIHELSHVLVAVLFGATVKGVYIRISGLSVNLKKDFNHIKELITYLAGPLANICLACLFFNVKMVFEINMCLFLINLAPLNPLDGYNILKTMLELIFRKEVACKLLKKISTICEIGIMIIGLILTIYYCNISLIIMLLYIKLMKLNSAK